MSGDKNDGEVKTGCPAFLEGCPYASQGDVIAWLQENAPSTIAKCPAFENGCPFKDTASVSDMTDALKLLPPSHTKEGELGHTALVQLLQRVHEASLKIKAESGLDQCPVFAPDAGGCPFKGAVCSNGVPLVDHLDTRSILDVLVRHAGHSVETEGLAAGKAEAKTEAEDSGVGRKRTASEAERHEVAVAEGLAVAKLLKEGTKVAHKAAENVHYVREFIHCRVTREVYKQNVANLYFVYQALEAAFDEHAAHPALAAIYYPKELHRTATLEKDLEFYWGADWKDLVEPTPIAREYVARLYEVSRNDPLLLVPHAYTRYMGDLSGGQVLKRSAVKAMGLPSNGDGVRFYEFEHVDNMKTFKKAYRQQLDSMPIDATAADRMVAEANQAFDLNTRLFHELDVLSGFSKGPVPGPAVFKPLTPEEKAAPAKCPFGFTGKAPAGHGHGHGAGQEAPPSNPVTALLNGVTSMPMGHPDVANAPPGAKCPFGFTSSGNADAVAAANGSRTGGAGKCEGGCAYKNFTLFDWAIVVAMVAVILLILPKDPDASLASGR